MSVWADQRGAWELVGGRVFTKAGKLVCQINLENEAHTDAGPLIAAAPRLTAALRAALEALQASADHLPPHSPADVAAARAVTLAFEALRLAHGDVTEEVPGCS